MSKVEYRSAVLYITNTLDVCLMPQQRSLLSFSQPRLASLPFCTGWDVAAAVAISVTYGRCCFRRIDIFLLMQVLVLLVLLLLLLLMQFLSLLKGAVDATYIGTVLQLLMLLQLLILSLLPR